MRGNPKAPIMIVEFSDYQCPYCHQAEPTVAQVLAKYGDKVSLSYRDFPLTSIHSQAMISAEASRCALEQGKFWEYHDQLFTRPSCSSLSMSALYFSPVRQEANCLSSSFKLRAYPIRSSFSSFDVFSSSEETGFGFVLPGSDFSAFEATLPAHL
jgi:hypothetical protein